MVFTSSGSEANQLAVRSALEAALLAGSPVHWVLSAVEHESLRKMIAWVETRGGRVSLWPVSEHGRLDLAALAGLLTPETRLVSVIGVQNETGVLSPVADAISLARSHGVPVHVDGAQMWGRVDSDLVRVWTTADYLAFSGAKLGALPGSGFALLPVNRAASPAILGDQEDGRRGGSVALLPAVALGAAAEAQAARMRRPAVARDVLQEWQTDFERRLSREFPAVRINGAEAPRAPGTVSLSFRGIGRVDLVAALDLAGFSVSAGSACRSGAREPSATLLAMGRTEAEAYSSVRVSVAEPLSAETEAAFFCALARILDRAARVSRETTRAAEATI